MNTHYAVIEFSGDLDNEHPDEELRGRAPRLELIAAGPEEHCWDALTKWTAKHPLQIWQTAEVLERDLKLVIQQHDESQRLIEEMKR